MLMYYKAAVALSTPVRRASVPIQGILETSRGADKTECHRDSSGMLVSGRAH